ncbi:MAG: hypothetical protein V3T86_16595 [Planctomycetota bacterium]
MVVSATVAIEPAASAPIGTPSIRAPLIGTPLVGATPVGTISAGATVVMSTTVEVPPMATRSLAVPPVAAAMFEVTMAAKPPAISLRPLPVETSSTIRSLAARASHPPAIAVTLPAHTRPAAAIARASILAASVTAPAITPASIHPPPIASAPVGLTAPIPIPPAVAPLFFLLVLAAIVGAPFLFLAPLSGIGIPVVPRAVPPIRPFARTATVLPIRARDAPVAVRVEPLEEPFPLRIGSAAVPIGLVAILCGNGSPEDS